ncbi:MAG: acid phosphatase [Hyphomicrobiales bacterium]|nr:acid phosphatase [Hyphomicrobiales bacterium]
MPMRRLPVTVLAVQLLTGAAGAQAPKPAPGLDKIDHIVVIYLENRSFDNLYGKFPGANGLSNAGAAATQVDRSGKPYDKLPPVMNSNLKPAAVDARFPADLPNGPFAAEPYVGLNQTTGDAVHRFYEEQMQIDGGKMDKFVAYTDAGSLVMSYFDGSKMPLWSYAQKYTLMDNFFHAAFGGSFLNHFYLVCACAPVFPNAPERIVAKLDDKGNVLKQGWVTPDGYGVNTIFALNGPYPKAMSDASLRLPLQTAPHIGDRLSAKNISWAWYSGGWNDALAGHPDHDFQFHHQVFAYFASTAIDTPAGKQHLKDEADLIADIHANRLPNVVFWKPIGEENEHPGYTNVSSGEHHVREVIRMIEKSPAWASTAIIVTYDENGGMWDHVAPPVIDRFGPGTRVPTLVISPYAKKGFVDHAQYDTTAILKLIETRWGLEPLASRDAQSGDMTTAFDFTQQ